ncbi:MAG: hypothetical protein AAFX54_03165 [Pseudomonadota bacterium]
MKKFRTRFSRRVYIAFACVAASLTAAPAHACYTVKFNNKSDKSLKVIWAATGCAGINNWVTYVCEHKTVKSGSQASYNYKWGTTAPLVTPVAFSVDSFGDADSLLSYKYGGGRFSFDNGANSVPGCGRSYTINFTEDDRQRIIKHKGY